MDESRTKLHVRYIARERLEPVTKAFFPSSWKLPRIMATVQSILTGSSVGVRT